MPVPKSKQGKPLGGIGAQAMTNRKHALVLDDRLLSKQYISNKADSKVDNTAYGASWADVSDTAPSKGAVQAYLASLTTNASHWSQDGTGNTAKTRTTDTGFVGIGAGAGLEYSDITERLTVDGNIKATGGLLLGSGAANTDYTITFDGESNDGLLTWMEDEDYFKFSDDLLINSTEKIYFNDTSQFIQGSSATVLSIGATDEIDLTATTIQVNGAADINGAADVSGNLTVGGNTTIAGDLTVTGTATAIMSETVNMQDNIIVLNSNATGSASVDAGIEIERGDDANRKLFWDESEDKWMIETATGVYTEIAGGGGTITGTNTGDVVINLASGVPAGAVSLSAQTVTFADSFVYNTGTNNIGTQNNSSDDGALQLYGTTGNSGTTGLVVEGGNATSSNPAVSITGALEATTKSFNIPHPLFEDKRLVYGSLEGPEHGMYGRGSFDVIDERRKVAVNLPNYWSAMVDHDYTISLASYGNYNVWITERNENGFWVETNSEKEWSFDWSAIGKRLDAKLVVEPDA